MDGAAGSSEEVVGPVSERGEDARSQARRNFTAVRESFEQELEAEMAAVLKRLGERFASEPPEGEAEGEEGQEELLPTESSGFDASNKTGGGGEVSSSEDQRRRKCSAVAHPEETEAEIRSPSSSGKRRQRRKHSRRRRHHDRHGEVAEDAAAHDERDASAEPRTARQPSAPRRSKWTAHRLPSIPAAPPPQTATATAVGAAAAALAAEAAGAATPEAPFLRFVQAASTCSVLMALSSVGWLLAGLLQLRTLPRVPRDDIFLLSLLCPALILWSYNRDQLARAAVIPAAAAVGSRRRGRSGQFGVGDDADERGDYGSAKAAKAADRAVRPKYQAILPRISQGAGLVALAAAAYLAARHPAVVPPLLACLPPTLVYSSPLLKFRGRRVAWKSLPFAKALIGLMWAALTVLVPNLVAADQPLPPAAGATGPAAAPADRAEAVAAAAAMAATAAANAAGIDVMPLFQPPAAPVELHAAPPVPPPLPPPAFTGAEQQQQQHRTGAGA
ncbi:unnamed protein product, partial [Phaeothamnion confervicola]